MISEVLSLLRVSDVKTLVSTFYPNSPNPHSKYVQLQRQLNVLVATGKLKRGTGWYSVPEYEGQFLEHDRKRTQILAELVRLKLPISVYTEVSFPIGIRSDIVCLIGKDSKATCAVIEICLNETVEYLSQKVVAWKNWTEATTHLGRLFNTSIPQFTLVSYGLNHPEMMDYQKLIEVLK